jgi:hypothetical protein
MRTLLMVGITAVVAFGAASEAGAVLLYEQVPDGSFSSPAAVSVDASADQVDAQAADDFTVPDGEVWTINGVEVLGAINTAATGTTANVHLYGGGGAVPGAPLFSQSSIPVPDCPGGSCNFTANVSGAPKLGPGTYWVSVQATAESLSELWYWAIYTPDATFGSPFVWQNPGNGFNAGSGCTSWTSPTNCAISTASDGKDLVFALNGDFIDSRFSITEFEARGLRLFAHGTFPGPGAAKISGKGVKKSTKQVAGGAQTLRVKLKPKITNRLRDGRKARAKVRIAFTATGGVAYPLTSKLTLVPAGRSAPAPGFRVVD